MCRSIHPLVARESVTTADDVRAAARQYVRKISGMRTPSRANEAAFEAAIDEIASASARLIETLVVARRA